MIFDEQVGECAVDVGAHFLAGLGRAKHANDGHPRLPPCLGGSEVIAKLGIVYGGSGLVVVDAVQSKPEIERIHVDGLGCGVAPQGWLETPKIFSYLEKMKKNMRLEARLDL